jgi:exodeoxyribonuclease III
MLIISWNINGIRAGIRNGFYDFLSKFKPDILLLQEIKIGHEAIKKTEFDFRGYIEYWNPAERPGYSGTAILVKDDLAKSLGLKVVWNGIGTEQYDQEGRVQTLEMQDFYVVNNYFPNTGRELARLDFKQDFNLKFLKYIKKLEKKKPVLAGGDFNVAHREIDIKNPQSNIKNAGFTPEERAWMDKFLANGLIDTFRYFNPQKIQYTWWSPMFKARDRNVGWRIDYFLTSKKFVSNIKDGYILDAVYGSDHCPVAIVLKKEEGEQA